MLPVHVSPDRLGGSAADVDELRLGRELDGPAGDTEAATEIHLVVEHEERRVETADLVERLAANEYSCPGDELRLTLRTVVEIRSVEGVQKLRARREPAEEEVLGREAPESWKAADRKLHAPIEIQEPGTDEGRARVQVEKGRESGDGVSDRPGIRVEQEHVLASREGNTIVVSRAVADVPIELQNSHGRVALAHDLDTRILRVTIDDYDLAVVAQHRRETPVEVSFRVERDDDHGHLRHVRMIWSHALVEDSGGRSTPCAPQVARRISPGLRSGLDPSLRLPCLRPQTLPGCRFFTG